MAKEDRELKSRTKSKNIIGMMTVFLIALICCATPAQAALISVEPECQIVSKGEYFTVNIYADPDGNETWAASYNLYFNNTLLNATSQVNGTFLSQDGASTLVVTNEINNIAGRIEYGETRQSPATTGVTDPGVLATITFEALTDGFCELGLGDWEGATTELIDVNLTPIPTDVNNGSVRIGLCGDVNNDESVDLGDVLDTFDHFMYSIPLPNEWAADVNKDDNIDLGDALDIFDHFMYGKDLNCRCGA